MRHEAHEDQEELRLIAVAFKLLGSGWAAFPHRGGDSAAVEVTTPDGRQMLVAPILKAQGGPGWSACLFLGEKGRFGEPTHRLPEQKGVPIPQAVQNFAENYGSGNLLAFHPQAT